MPSLKAKRFEFVLGIICFLSISNIALGTILPVPEEYPTIQSALDIAMSGDVVSVGPGVYYEHVNFQSHDVTLKSRIPHGATIDGGGSGHVVVCNPYRATIEGFVITGGGGTYHAGVFTSQASQTIRDNVITGNLSHGIVISSGSEAWIENNIIADNGDWGAGIRVRTGASGTVVNNYIAQNRYGLDCVDAGQLIVCNNTIVHNVAWNLYFGSTVAELTNNIIAEAEIGILFVGDYATDITQFVAQYLTIHYNDVWGHSMSDYYAELVSIPYGNSGPFLPLPGVGEIHADPLLDTEVDYHLTAGSPCVDAGNNDTVPAPITTDLDGNARFADDPDTPDTGLSEPPIVDMGAHEFRSQPSSVPFGSDTGGDVVLSFAGHPNPFSSSATFSYFLHRGAAVRLTIYDMRGRVVATAVDEMQDAGLHLTAWNGRTGDNRRVAAGMYVARLEAGGEIRIKKIVVSR